MTFDFDKWLWRNGDVDNDTVDKAKAKSEAVRVLVAAGFVPYSVVQAVAENDMSKLRHSGEHV